MFAVVQVSNFSLQAALRHEPDLRTRPVALMDAGDSKVGVVQLNPEARKYGVTEGLTASQATARCGGLIIKNRSATQEEAATQVLLQTAYTFAANIESTAPGICTMELKGLRLETEQALQEWAAGIVRTLVQFNLNAVVGVSTTPALARLAARAASPILVVLDSNGVIDALPVRFLEPAPELAEILHRWGIRTIGAFAALGKDKIAERLGQPALELLERVFSPVRPLKLVSPPRNYEEQIDVEYEIQTIEPLLFVLRRFVEQLSRRLEAEYLVIGEFHLQFGLSSEEKYQHHFKIPTPTGSIETFFRMLQTHLENVRTNAPIVSVRLAAKPSVPIAHQFGLFETTLRNPNQFAETLARLTALCGSERVGTPVLESTYRSDAFKLKVPDFNAPAPSRTDDLRGLQLRRFRPVLPAIVEFRAQKPVLISSQACRGPISDFRGPFTSSGNWWENERWEREEWDVQTADKTLYRIFRAPEGFFVEGVYD